MDYCQCTEAMGAGEDCRRDVYCRLGDELSSWACSLATDVGERSRRFVLGS